MCILMYIGNYIIYCIGIYLFYFLIMESDSWTDARTLKQQQNCTLYCHNYVIPWLGEES